MRFVIAIVSIALLQSACSTLDLNRRMSSWQDMHYEEVIDAWGKPDTCDDDGELVVCQWHVEDPERIDRLPGAAPACVRMLAMNQAGTITGWRWRGNRCPRLAQRIAAVPSTALAPRLLATASPR